MLGGILAMGVMTYVQGLREMLAAAENVGKTWLESRMTSSWIFTDD